MITQTEVNAVFDEQVSLCADTLQKKTKEYTGDNTDRLGVFKVAALQHATLRRALVSRLHVRIISQLINIHPNPWTVRQDAKDKVLSGLSVNPVRAGTRHHL